MISVVRRAAPSKHTRQTQSDKKQAACSDVRDLRKDPTFLGRLLFIEERKNG